MKRGRKSSAEIAVRPGANPASSRLRPPADLGKNEARLFREIVASCSPSHFVHSDAPLLAAYCTAVCISRDAARELATDAAAIVAWEKSTRMQATLATRLRLAPQSRADPKTVARRQSEWRPSAYDLMESDDER